MGAFCSAVSKKSPLVTCKYLKCDVTSATKGMESFILFYFIVINLSSQMFLVTTSLDSTVKKSQLYTVYLSYIWRGSMIYDIFFRNDPLHYTCVYISAIHSYMG